MEREEPAEPVPTAPKPKNTNRLASLSKAIKKVSRLLSWQAGFGRARFPYKVKARPLALTISGFEFGDLLF